MSRSFSAGCTVRRPETGHVLAAMAQGSPAGHKTSAGWSCEPVSGQGYRRVPGCGLLARPPCCQIFSMHVSSSSPIYHVPCLYLPLLPNTRHQTALRSASASADLSSLSSLSSTITSCANTPHLPPGQEPGHLALTTPCSSIFRNLGSSQSPWCNHELNTSLLSVSSPNPHSPTLFPMLGR